MIGREAYQFLLTNKAIIDTVTLVDIECNKLKCFYERDIEDVLNDQNWFKSDITDDWNTYNDEAYLLLHEISFKKVFEEVNITKMTTDYALENNIIDENGRYIK